MVKLITFMVVEALKNYILKVFSNNGADSLEHTHTHTIFIVTSLVDNGPNETVD